MRIVDDNRVRMVVVDNPKTGAMSCSPEKLAEQYPEVIDRKLQLIAENQQQEWFASPEVIEREVEERLQKLLNPRIIVVDPLRLPPEKLPVGTSPFED